MNDLENQERIVRLEQKVEALDRAIEEIKKEQITARDCREDASVTMAELNGKIDKVIEKLSDKKTSAYKATDVILALGMIALTLMQYLK